MQIKRFEAADMTEALRLVKREFGDDAVILSAKEVRPGGFFSALRKKSVKISAATDYPMDKTRENNNFSGLLSKQLNIEEETDRVSLSSSPQAPAPFSQKSRSVVHRQPVSEKQHGPLDRSVSIKKQGVFLEEVNPELEQTCSGRAGEGAITEVYRHADGLPPIAEPFYRDAAGRKVIALVGPCGVGKTTTVAKMAWHCRIVEKKRVGLISLDRFRIGANGMLSRISSIMNLPLSIVHDTGQLQSALNDLSDVDVVLIDTPGVSGKDTSMMNEVRKLLRIADPDETHLVVNTTVRDDVFDVCVANFSRLGVDRLLLTHLDEQIDEAAGWNLVEKAGLASSFYADGVDLSDGFHEYTADRTAGISSNDEPGGGQVTLFSRKRGQINSGRVNSDTAGDSVNYVANRNSELFHHSSCKSVKRINAENITAFNSIEQAMDEGFKPCRACCDISMIRKPAAEGFGYQRSRAI